MAHGYFRSAAAFVLVGAFAAFGGPLSAQQPATQPSPAAALPAATEPAALIQGFNGVLLDVMRNAKTLGYAGRREILGRKIGEVYHLPVMARIAVGSHWRTLPPAQRDTLVDGFSRMTVATYAARFDGWSGESFEMRGVDTVRAKTVLVKTAIIRPNDDPVEINYLMREFSTGWRVIDVFLKQSYSELATKRSEYSSIIRRQGFTALMAQIEAKISQYANGGK